MHYLKAVQATGTDEAKAVMAKMRGIPVNDVMTKNGELREDGRLMPRGASPTSIPAAAPGRA